MYVFFVFDGSNALVFIYVLLMIIAGPRARNLDQQLVELTSVKLPSV